MVPIEALTGPDKLREAVLQLGFLPFFKNEIPGFSIAEHTPPRLWFSETEAGPWEWKGPVARTGECVYGKFFRGRAGFISMEFFPIFANYRRGGYESTCAVTAPAAEAILRRAARALLATAT